MSGASLLRRLRSDAGLSQEALAERSGLSERTIRALESGAAKRPHRDTLLAVAAALALAPGETEVWLSAWRPTRRSLGEVLTGNPPTETLRAELDAQRLRTRDLLVRTLVEIRADRTWARHTVERVVEVLEDGVDTFCWMLGYPVGMNAARFGPIDCVNVEPIASADFPGRPARIFYGSLEESLQAGDVYTLSYSFDHDAASPDGARFVPDDDIMFLGMAATPALLFEARFDPAALPARVHRVRQSTVDEPTEPGQELQLSPFGVAALSELPAAVGVHGIRWEWT